MLTRQDNIRLLHALEYMISGLNGEKETKDLSNRLRQSLGMPIKWDLNTENLAICDEYWQGFLEQTRSDYDPEDPNGYLI